MLTLAGYRSASSAAGSLCISSNSAGETIAWPGSGNRGIPAGSAIVAESTVDATSTRVIGWPAEKSCPTFISMVAEARVKLGVCQKDRSARTFVANGRLTSNSTSPVATATPTAVRIVEVRVRRSARNTRNANRAGFTQAPPLRSGHRG